MELFLAGYTVIFNVLTDKWELFISDAWGGSPKTLPGVYILNYHHIIIFMAHLVMG